jgi:hypothetical protein
MWGLSDLFIDRSDSRTRIVKELGFASYQKYLASPLWQRIKRSAYFHVGAFYPICRRCHETIHFDENRRKLSLAETDKRLKYMMRK